MAESALGGDSEKVEQQVLDENPSEEHPVDEDDEEAESENGGGGVEEPAPDGGDADESR
jgi:hypothetical protein